MSNQVDASAIEKADLFMLAIRSMDSMVAAADGNAERAIGLMMLAAAVKGGQPALDYMKHYLPAIDGLAIASGKELFMQGYRPETRQQRRTRVRKVSGGQKLLEVIADKEDRLRRIE